MSLFIVYTHQKPCLEAFSKMTLYISSLSKTKWFHLVDNLFNSTKYRGGQMLERKNNLNIKFYLQL